MSKNTQTVVVSNLAPLALIALILTGCLTILYTTAQWGIGTGADSLIYLDTAQHLLRGEGFTTSIMGTRKPFTHFPPLYPLLLAGGSLVSGESPFVVARWVSVGSFALLLGTIAWVMRRMTNGAVWIPIITLAVLILSPQIILIQTLAFTEPIFLVFTLATFFLLVCYREQEQILWLVLAGIASALALLTRYVGITILLAVGIELMFLGNTRSFRKRLGDTILYMALASVPMAGWVGRNMLVADTAANRELTFHPPGYQHFQEFLYPLVTWVSPTSTNYPIPFAVRMLLTALFIGAGIAIWYRNRHQTVSPSSPLNLLAYFQAYPFARILGVFVATYLGFLLFSISFIDFLTPLDYRILMPAIMMLFLLVMLFIHEKIAQQPPSTRGKLGLAVVFVVFGVFYAQGTYATIRRLHDHGVLYSGREWQESALLQEIAHLPPDTIIYTNAPDITRFVIGRTPDALPSKFNPNSLIPSATYPDEMATMRTAIVQRGAMIAYFPSLVLSRDYMPTPEELQEEIPLVPVVTVADGVLYAAPQQ